MRGTFSHRHPLSLCLRRHDTVERRVGLRLDVELRACRQADILAVHERAGDDADRAEDGNACKACTSGHRKALHLFLGFLADVGVDVGAIDGLRLVEVDVDLRIAAEVARLLDLRHRTLARQALGKDELTVDDDVIRDLVADGIADLEVVRVDRRDERDLNERLSRDTHLVERQDGEWRVSALSLSAPTFFTVSDVLDRSLGQIHDPVHGFNDRFLKRVERIFEGLRPGLVLQRRNWSVVNSAEPFTPDSAPIRARIPAIRPEQAADELFVRVERQTLRRLPQTGGALFTIRVWLHPLGDLADDPPRLAAFARAWREAAPAFRAYKRLPLYDELVTRFLRAHGESHSVNGN